MITEYYATQLDELLMDGVDGKHFPEDEVIQMALDAARGLQALHEVPEGPVVHADLQPRQLMRDEHGVVKLNDLNRCRFMGRDAAGNPCPFRINKSSGVWRSPEEYAWEVRRQHTEIVLGAIILQECLKRGYRERGLTILSIWTSMWVLLRV